MTLARPTTRLRRLAVALGAALVALTIAGAATTAQDASAAPGRPGPTPLPAEVRTAPDPVDLIADDGAPFTLTALRGHWTILFFGYTHCPDVCPATLGELLGALNERPDLRIVFISVDPERDTPEFMAEWTKYLPDGFVGVAGSPLAIRAAADLYGVQYARVDADSGKDYSMAHTAFQYLVDPDGQLVLTWVFGTPTDAILSDIAALEEAAGPVTVSDAWVRASAMMSMAGAAYLTIRNAGETDDALVSVTTPAAGSATIHETTTDAKGQMGMQPVDAIPVPAGGDAVLAPGGYHVMLMDLTGPLDVGQTIELTLTFASGRVVTTTAEIRPLDAGMPMGSPMPGGTQMDHGQMGHAAASPTPAP